MLPQQVFYLFFIYFFLSVYSLCSLPYFLKVKYNSQRPWRSGNYSVVFVILYSIFKTFSLYFKTVFTTATITRQSSFPLISSHYLWLLFFREERNKRRVTIAGFYPTMLGLFRIHSGGLHWKCIGYNSIRYDCLPFFSCQLSVKVICAIVLFIHARPGLCRDSFLKSCWRFWRSGRIILSWGFLSNVCVWQNISINTCGSPNLAFHISFV